MCKYFTTGLSSVLLAFFGFSGINIVLAEQPPAYLSTSFYGGGIVKDRQDQKFREDWLLRDDSFVGGIEHLVLRYPFKEDWLLKSEIKALPGQRNYDLALEVSKKDLFYARIHYKKFQYYDDDSGGVYKPFSIPFYVIPEEPDVERENLLLEFGLTLPNLPIFTFSYEKKKRDGEISSLTWGEAAESGIDRHIVPTIKDVDDDGDIFKLGAKYEHDIMNIEVEQRWESTDIDSVRTEVNFDEGLPNASAATVIDDKDTHYKSSQTTVKLDKTINKKLSISSGYRYNNIDNDSKTILRTFNASGVINPGGRRRNWFAPNSDSDVDSHLWNFNILGKPMKGLTVQGSLRVKYIHRSSVATYFNDSTFPFDFSPDEAHDITARINDTIFGEAIRVTYKRIPRIIPYFEAGWQQGDSEIKEQENLTGFFKRDTDRNFDKQIYTIGTSFFPFKRFSGSFQYRKELTKNEYSDDLDTESRTAIVPGGYPAFIDKQDIDTDIYTTRLTAHPMRSITTTFRYEYRSQETDSKMDGLSRELSHVDTQTFSGSVTIIPISNFFLTTMVMHQNLRVKTRARDDIRAAFRPFEGDSTSFVSTAIFALNEKTEFSVDYQVSLTDNYDESVVNFAPDPGGLPLEHDYTLQVLTLGVKHKVKKNISLWCKYRLHDFSESHRENIDNYTEHLFVAGGEIRFR